MPTLEAAEAPPSRKPGTFTTESARIARAKVGTVDQASDGITNQMLRKASSAVASLNPTQLKDGDKLALARAAADIAGLRRTSPEAPDTLDDRILRAYREAGETP